MLNPIIRSIPFYFGKTAVELVFLHRPSPQICGLNFIFLKNTFSTPYNKSRCLKVGIYLFLTINNSDNICSKKLIQTDSYLQSVANYLYSMKIRTNVIYLCRKDRKKCFAFFFPIKAIITFFLGRRGCLKM